RGVSLRSKFFVHRIGVQRSRYDGANRGDVVWSAGILTNCGQGCIGIDPRGWPRWLHGSQQASVGFHEVSRMISIRGATEGLHLRNHEGRARADMKQLAHSG